MGLDTEKETKEEERERLFTPTSRAGVAAGRAPDFVASVSVLP